jgi:hypothetical protein
MSEDHDRPVLSGLAALIGVGLAVGLIAGIAALVGAHLVGLNGGKAEAGAGGAGQTMFLPKPQKTNPSNGPSITLGTSPTSGTTATATPGKPHKPRKRISLQAGEAQVAPMGRIDLTGTYPGGEGAVLQVQKFSAGSWQDFYSISVTVSNATFSTYIQTGTPGVNRFRVIDSDTKLASNEVRVTIG